MQLEIISKNKKVIYVNNTFTGVIRSTKIKTEKVNF
jgi:hypothetical protein